MTLIHVEPCTCTCIYTPHLNFTACIKYNRLNKLYSMANGPKEKWIEMGTQRDREVRERERIMCPSSAHA